jgi:hypothetical protein
MPSAGSALAWARGAHALVQTGLRQALALAGRALAMGARPPRLVWKHEFDDEDEN